MKLFGKKNKEEKKLPKSEIKIESKEQETAAETKTSFTPVQESIITGFYISEKAGLLNGFNQYVFKVSNNANKSLLTKQVEKMFNVKVKDIKILNTPEKRRDIGKYSGFKPGFKKAIVVLEKGYTIEQAKA